MDGRKDRAWWQGVKFKQKEKKKRRVKRERTNSEL